MATNIRLPVWSIFCYLCVYVASKRKKITFVDTSSIPHAVRVIGPGQIYIEGKKNALSAAYAWKEGKFLSMRKSSKVQTLN